MSTHRIAVNKRRSQSARVGYYEILFNYRSIQWDHTDSSDQAPRVG